MSASKGIKQITVERDLSVKNLASLLEMKPQILSNKLYRDTFTYTDYIKIANITVLCCQQLQYRWLNCRTGTADCHKKGN